MSSVAEMLDRAADLIEERGWTSGALGWGDIDPDSGLCLEGGIAAAVGLEKQGDWLLTGELKACPAYRAVSEYLSAESLWVWNDWPHRTAEEVIGVLRAVAVVEAARESVAVTS